jgi:hypothetical protein
MTGWNVRRFRVLVCGRCGNVRSSGSGRFAEAAGVRW